MLNINKSNIQQEICRNSRVLKELLDDMDMLSIMLSSQKQEYMYIN